MLKFLKNHWASIAFVLCAMAVFAVELYVPFCSLTTRILLGYAVLSVPAFFLGLGVNIETEQSWLTFIIISSLFSIIQCVIGVIMVPFLSDLPVIISGGVCAALWNFIVSVFAIRILDDPLEKLRKKSAQQPDTDLSKKEKCYFWDGKPVRVEKLKITQVEEQESNYKIWFERGTWIYLHKIKKKGKKPAPPKIGDWVTLYWSPYGGDVLACAVRRKFWYRANRLEEREVEVL